MDTEREYQSYTYRLPARWGPAILDGDSSQLSADDVDRLQAALLVIEYEIGDWGNVRAAGREQFGRYDLDHIVGFGAGQVCVFSFQVFK